MRKISNLITTILALFLCIQVYATDITLHEGENKINVSDFMVNATYTAKTTGKVVIDASTAFEVTCNGQTYVHSYAPGAQHGAYHYEVNAETGQVITLVNNMFFNNGTSIWVSENGAGPVPVTVQQVSPKSGVAFGWAHAGQMTINFNKSVTFDNLNLVAGGRKYEVDEVTAGSSVGCNLRNAIEKALTDGSMKEGDQFVVRLEGLCEVSDPTNLYNGNGVLEIPYLAPAMQGKMVSATADGQAIQIGTINNYTMLSYYDPEGQNGQIKFEFDKKVKKAERVCLRMGELDRSSEGLYYEGNVPYTIDGNTLTVDLRTELRSYARLFPGVDLEAMEVAGTEPFTTISLSLVNVTDESGNPMASDAIGTVGSYTYTFNYKEISDNIVMDGDRPEDVEGSEKAEGDYVQLWIDQEVKSIDGIYVYFKVVDEGQGVDADGNPAYVEGSAQVAEKEIKIISSDSFDGTVLGFTIPKLQKQIEIGGAYIPAAAGQPLRVVLKVKTMNGMPHDLSINYVLRSNADGIGSVQANVQKLENHYNLNGQPIGDAQARGIVICGGKKILK